MSDKRLERAVDAGLAILSQQDSTLGSIRNRAAAVLTTAALVTSFAGGLGLLGKQQFPHWAALALLGVLVPIGALVVMVQWPLNQWAAGLDPALILARIDSGDSEDALDRYLAQQLHEAMADNEGVVRRRGLMYRLAAGFLVVEVLILAAALAFK